MREVLQVFREIRGAVELDQPTDERANDDVQFDELVHGRHSAGPRAVASKEAPALRHLLNEAQKLTELGSHKFVILPPRERRAVYHVRNCHGQFHL